MLPAVGQQALVQPANVWQLAAVEPFTPPGPCPELARRQTLYRVCDDQRVLFREAIDAARHSGKLLLVTFGATWCPSCRSFSTQLEQAADSETSPASRFTRVEIAISTIKDGRRVPVATGEDVLHRVLAASAPGTSVRSVPFIAVVDPNNAARSFTRNLDDAEVASGGAFDLQRIGAILTQADAHMRQGAEAPSEPGWFRRKLRRWFAI